MTGSERSAGFTLIEALVASTIFTLIIVGVFTVYTSNASMFNRGQTRTEAYQNARVGVELIAREIRVAGYDLSDSIATLAKPHPIQVAENARLSFVADIDRDGVLDLVSYRLVGDELWREFSSKSGSAFGPVTSSIVADGLGTLRFTYTDDIEPAHTTYLAPVADSDLDKIRQVRVGITTSATAVRETAGFTHTVDVRLRN